MNYNMLYDTSFLGVGGTINWGPLSNVQIGYTDPTAGGGGYYPGYPSYGLYPPQWQQGTYYGQPQTNWMPFLLLALIALAAWMVLK